MQIATSPLSVLTNVLINMNENETRNELHHSSEPSSPLRNELHRVYSRNNQK